jgi:WD40 repeat protein
MMMIMPLTCFRCGAELAPDAPYGLCPACVFEGAGSQVDSLEAGALVQPGPGWDGPRRFGAYELLEEIARGGMGIVFKARQVSLNRLVAVKMILSGGFASEHLIRRFRAEVTTAALLQHPNIVAIHEVGVHEGQHFYSMDYVQGQNLTQLVRNRPVPTARAARYVRTVAQAIHYAHEQGVLHRDLKPSNVLVDAATDEARVADFGLAKRLEGESSLTCSGQMLGSPNFMPPEQAASQGAKVGRQSDVYGLGAILYYLVTARPPFQADTVASTVHQVLTTEPLAPRLMNPSLPSDLETICLKCLEKEPSRRYQTAQEVAEELGRFLGDEPIRARPVSRAERFWRWGRRNSALASALGVAALLFLTIGIGSPIALFAVNRQRVRAEAATLQARAQAYTSDMSRVLQEWEAGNLGQAQALLTKHVPVDSHTPDLRGFEWRYLWQLCRNESLQTIPLPPKDRVWLPSSTPAHGFVAAACDKAIRLFDPSDGRELATLAYPNPAASNPYLVLALATGATNLLAAHRANGIVGIWDVERMELLTSCKAFDRNVGALALSPDGKRLAAGDRLAFYGTTISVWDISAPSGPPRPLWSHSTQGDATTALAFTPDGQTLVAARSSSEMEVKLHFWEAATGTEHEALPNASAGNIVAIALSPDGKLLAAAGVEATIRVWDLVRRALEAQLEGPSASVASLDFSRDGRRLVSGGSDGAIRVWDVASQKRVEVKGNPEVGEVKVVYAPDGKSLVSANGSRLRVWATGTNDVKGVIKTPGWGWPLISPNGRWLVVSLPGNRARPVSAEVWDPQSSRQKLELAYKGGFAQSLAFSPDSRWFALLRRDWLAFGIAQAGIRVACGLPSQLPISQTALKPDRSASLQTAKCWRRRACASLPTHRKSRAVRRIDWPFGRWARGRSSICCQRLVSDRPKWRRLRPRRSRPMAVSWPSVFGTAGCGFGIPRESASSMS